MKLKDILKENIDWNKANPDNFEGFIKVRKKPIVIDALKVNIPFSVNTIEGKMEGKKGDWLMIGLDGEKYICDDSLFKRTYDILDGEKI